MKESPWIQLALHLAVSLVGALTATVAASSLSERYWRTEDAGLFVLVAIAPQVIARSFDIDGAGAFRWLRRLLALLALVPPVILWREEERAVPIAMWASFFVGEVAARYWHGAARSSSGAALRLLPAAGSGRWAGALVILTVFVIGGTTKDLLQEPATCGAVLALASVLLRRDLGHAPDAGRDPDMPTGRESIAEACKHLVVAGLASTLAASLLAYDRGYSSRSYLSLMLSLAAPQLLVRSFDVAGSGRYRWAVRLAALAAFAFQASRPWRATWIPYWTALTIGELIARLWPMYLTFVLVAFGLPRRWGGILSPRLFGSFLIFLVFSFPGVMTGLPLRAAGVGLVLALAHLAFRAPIAAGRTVAAPGPPLDHDPFDPAPDTPSLAVGRRDGPPEIAALAARFDAIRQQIDARLEGVDAPLDAAMIALLSGGHLLLEAGPGTGKTELVRSFAEAFGLTFRRHEPGVIEAPGGASPATAGDAPRLLPTAHVLLVPGIDDAPPAFRSALLAAMHEAPDVTSITEGGAPLLVVATRLPAAHDAPRRPASWPDRFQLQARIGPPSRPALRRVVDRALEEAAARRPLAPLSDLAQLLADRQTARRLVDVPAAVRERIAHLVEATHHEGRVPFGAGPRAARALALACVARAALDGRAAASSDDVHHLAGLVLAHRVPREA